MSNPAAPTPPTFDFFVKGIAAPGGSKRVFVPRKKDGSFIYRPNSNQPMVNVTDDAGKRNKEWRKTVAWQVKAALPAGYKPTEGAVKCFFHFWMMRPADEHVANDRTRPLKPSAQVYHLSAPDALKLARSTEDALTGILWVDDRQVVSGGQTKQYCDPGQEPGCRVRIWLL